jgi:4-hydroxy-tetrahydrodipicolinate reductase
MASSSPVRIGIAGALGRMGRAVAAAAEQRPGVEITALYDAPGTEGQIAEHEGGRGRVLVTRDQAAEMCDVIIDFTVPDATAALARLAEARGAPALILGSTGLREAHLAAIDAAAKKVAVVRTGNFSLGVNTLVGLVRQVAERLGPDAWDIEIFEAHHKRKVDAPSGTALMLGEAAAAGRDVGLGQVSDRARDGITGPRKTGDIGFSVMRGGGIIGEHSVSFVSEDEILTLSHSARDRSLFARGAVEAALWAAGRPAGLYDMMDVLGFKS